MEKTPKIADVKPLPGKRLEVEFDNGIRKEYDCNPVLVRPEFYLLKEDAFFNTAKVDSGGYGISWNDQIDLSEYEVWVNGVEKMKAKNGID
jgi:hypothetical protein